MALLPDWFPPFWSSGSLSKTWCDLFLMMRVPEEEARAITCKNSNNSNGNSNKRSINGRMVKGRKHHGLQRIQGGHILVKTANWSMMEQ